MDDLKTVITIKSHPIVDDDLMEVIHRSPRLSPITMAYSKYAFIEVFVTGTVDVKYTLH